MLHPWTWAGFVVLVVWMSRGGPAAAQFFTGYLLEKALSVDNLFVFLLIFAQFRVPPGEQHRVLTWGILGALLLRGAMILGELRLIRLLGRVVPFVPRYEGGRFLTREGGRRVGTMLLFVLVVVECSDALF